MSPQKSRRRLSTFLTTRNLLFKHQLANILALTIILVCALGPTTAYFENSSPQANIHTSVDGLWWAISTVTTVGYGDYYPVTLFGRITSIVLMTIGLSTFSILTANIAALIVEQDEESQMVTIKNRLYSLEEKTNRIIKLLEKPPQS